MVAMSNIVKDLQQPHFSRAKDWNRIGSQRPWLPKIKMLAIEFIGIIIEMAAQSDNDTAY